MLSYKMNLYKRYKEQITEEEETHLEWKNKKKSQGTG